MSQQIFVRAFTPWFWDKRNDGQPILRYLGHTDKYQLCAERLQRFYKRWLVEENYSDADIDRFTTWLVRNHGFVDMQSCSEEGYIVIDSRKP